MDLLPRRKPGVSRSAFRWLPALGGPSRLWLFALAILAALALVAGRWMGQVDSANTTPSPRHEYAQGMAVKPEGDDSLVFSIPIGERDIHYFGDYWSGLGGVAVAGDGSIWIADADSRLLHYGAGGKLLNAVASPIS